MIIPNVLNNFNGDLKKRLIGIGLISIIILPIILLSVFSHSVETTWLKVFQKISITLIVSAISIYGFYEILNNFTNSKIINFIYSTVLILGVYFLDVHLKKWQPLLFLELLDSSITLDWFYIKRFGFNTIIYLFIIVCSLVYFILNWDTFNKVQNSLAVLILALTIVFFSKGMVYLLIIKPWYSFYLFVLVFLYDVFSYFGGRLIAPYFKQYLFFPKISPNKTIIGALSGFMASLVFSITFLSLIHEQNQSNSMPIISHLSRLVEAKINFYIIIFFFSFFFSLAPISGDLFFSYIKRALTIKDFSSLILGHGGVFDRFDGLAFTTFVFVIMIW
ncbi:MAG: phosphatidate cytidylyltransferase [Mycoplasma sp.]|nr:phosphatidate cytidylyltransferase [Mycoplasma sp.]